MRCDGEEGTRGGGSGADGASLAFLLAVSSNHEDKVHLPASEDELLQAMAGGALPARAHQI